MKRYPIDYEGNVKVSRAEINRQIEQIEQEIQLAEEEQLINQLRADWNYLMSL